MKQSMMNKVYISMITASQVDQQKRRHNQVQLRRICQVLSSINHWFLSIRPIDQIEFCKIARDLMLLWKHLMFLMIRERCHRASTILQVRIQTLKKCSKWKSCKQKMKDRIWVWEETILKVITRHLLCNNNMLILKGRWKRMRRIMSLKTRFSRSEEVILPIILTKKLILLATLICSNPYQAHYRNKIAKTKQPMKFWISNLKTHQGWIILCWNLKELYYKN